MGVGSPKNFGTYSQKRGQKIAIRLLQLTFDCYTTYTVILLTSFKSYQAKAKRQNRKIIIIVVTCKQEAPLRFKHETLSAAPT